MEPLPSLSPPLPTRRPQHHAPQQHSRKRSPLAFTAAAIFLLSSSLPTSASTALKSSRGTRRIGSQPAFLHAPQPPSSPTSFASSVSSSSSFPPYYHAPRPLAATPLPRNDKDKKTKGGGSTGPIKSRSGLTGTGLTREKAVLGAVGGSLGVWGIFTAARNLQSAADKASSRAFVWKEPSKIAKKKLEGGGLSGPGLSLTPQGVFSLAFVTYLARFLLNFDSSVANWWASEVLPTAPVSSSKGSPARQRFLMSRFGEFSTTVELGLAPFASKGREGAISFCQRLADRYIGPESETYARGTPEGRRIREQLALLFSLLPPSAQPTPLIRDLLASLPPSSGTSRIFQVETLGSGQSKVLMDQTVRGMGQDPLMLLPARNMVPFPVDEDGREGARQGEAVSYRVPGLQSVMEGAYYGRGGGGGGRGEGDAAAAAARGFLAPEMAVARPIPPSIPSSIPSSFPPSPFGPIADRPVMKERPLDLQTYLLFALAGAVGCAGTHSLVVPIVSPAAALQYHAPLVVLAGALATVIACLGVCPAEALRIRMVANAETFGETWAGAVEQEGGAPSLWDGFPPLVVRQVLFGMMKFVVFDSVGTAIFAAAPFLRESVASSLGVSLVSGAMAGVASAIISQPADTILSKMNADARPGVMEAVSSILTENGLGGFFVGLGTRCLWSGSIISGQFLLYDVFRSLLHVSNEDLSQYMDVIGTFGS
ncbi:mitochondrial substrate carrier family protein [Nannochloropsis oceanica]